VASLSTKTVDYMTVYTSDLVKAVRKAAGNIGMTLLKYFYNKINNQYVSTYNY
jgi:hypothetical protein